MPRWLKFETYFWSKVIKSPSGCWEWQGGLLKGYGRVHYKGKRCAAHRVSYELKKGPIPVGLNACHKCDNKKCVRPSHIFIGTQGDNVQDCTDKGRNTLIQRTKNNPTLYTKNHWSKTKAGRKFISDNRKKAFADGRVENIFNSRGQIMGTKTVKK